jgi:exodeoxyribonuclease-3
MKIASWNINSIRMRLKHLQEFLDENDPDILLLQEIKCENNKFPYDELSNLSYNIYVHGQKSYNGVAILCKFARDEIKYNFPNNPCPEESRFLEITINSSIGLCHIISLYAPNGGEVGSDKFLMKLKFYDKLIDYLESLQSFDAKILIGGDFNIAPFNIDVYSPEHLANVTCFTKEEKQKIRRLFNVGFEDLYRLHNVDIQEFSWFDYRNNAFVRNQGTRIDLLVASSDMSNYSQSCYIDSKMRNRDKPSDHAPIISLFSM